METIQTEIEGVVVLKPRVFEDGRGYFFESYSKRDFDKQVREITFIQDNESSSTRGVLRGLHYQKNHTQGKLVRVTWGEVFDVAVDLRKDSPTFGKWFGAVLSEQNKKQFFIPKNFAHGFLVLTDTAEFCYKCTDFYHPGDEGGLPFDDKEIGVRWPDIDGELNINARDRGWPSFAEYKAARGIV